MQKRGNRAMKDLFWKVLDHLTGYEGFPAGPERSQRLDEARDKVDAMTNLELLQAISDVFDKEAGNVFND